MINAVVEHKDKTLVLEFPKDIYNLYHELQMVGIRKTPYDIRLTDDEDDPIRVKLYADSDIGNHLIRILNEHNSIEDANTVAYVVSNANELIREDLEQNIIHDQYESVTELYADIRQMVYDAGSVSETFYFPLTGNIYEEDYDVSYEVDPYFLAEQEDAIREKLNEYMERDTNNMAKYYNRIGKEKLLSADWDVVSIGGTLYGKVDIRLTEAMSAEEKESLVEWICGQNSDGAGEGFEQQDIEIEEGSLNVSFWNSGDDYFIHDQEEMEAYIQSQQGQQFGGM